MKRKWMSLLLAGVMVFACGCGTGEPAISVGESTSTDGDASQIVGQSNNGLGRYVEENLTMPEMFGTLVCTAQLSDGSMRMADFNGMIYESKDNGATWELRNEDWSEQFSSGIYINAMAISQEGEYALSYSVEEADEEETTEDTQTNVLVVDADSTLSEDDMSYIPDYLYVNEKGEQLAIAADLGENNFMRKMFFTPSGRLLCLDLTGQIYEVDKQTGTISKLLNVGGYAEASAVTDKYFIALVDKKAKLYDISTGAELEEDGVLNNFLGKEGNVGEGFNSDASAALFMQAENEDTLYVATQSGLFRHVIGGTVMELLIDGTLSTFGSPSVGMVNMHTVGENEFLVFFTGKTLVHFTYDKTISSVPDIQLKVYGLQDNATVRQAINEFQKQNSDVYVEYEIGMTADSGVTREDALKNLNTEILAGTGPDVLVMDDISVDTYRDKGILADVTPYLTELKAEGKLYEKILSAYEKDGAVYAVPCKFSMPLFVGKTDEIGQIKDLESLTEVVRQIRKENPTRGILGTVSEKQLIQMLLSGCETGMISATGGLDEKTLTQFLTQAKELYELEGHEPTAEELSDYENLENIIDAVQIGNQVLEIPLEEAKLVYGYSSGEFDYALATSLLRTMPEYSFTGADFGYGKTYYPSTIIALSTASKQTEAAGKFIEVLLSESVQAVSLGDGFPINREAMKTIFDTVEAGEVSGMIGMSMDSGAEFSMDVYWPDEQQQEEFFALADSLDTPNTMDATVKETIITSGVNAVNGSREIAEVVKEIMDKISLRASE